MVEKFVEFKTNADAIANEIVKAGNKVGDLLTRETTGEECVERLSEQRA